VFEPVFKNAESELLASREVLKGPETTGVYARSIADLKIGTISIFEALDVLGSKGENQGQC